MRNTATPTDTAHTKRTAMTVAFWGANNPKLANVIVSQNRRIIRKGRGIDDPPMVTCPL